MHAAGLKVINDLLSATVLLMLGVVNVTCARLIGCQEGALSFILLVTLALFATLDLSQPYRGVINVSQGSIQ